EGHGREEIGPAIDVSRTVGWFTSLFPVRLTVPTDADEASTLKAVKEQLRAVPQRGFGYGGLRYLSASAVCERLRALPQPEIGFNFLGDFDTSPSDTSLFRLVTDDSGPPRSPRATRAHVLDVNAAILDGRLQIEWSGSSGLFLPATIDRVATMYLDALRQLIAHCLEPDAGGLTPSDVPGVRLSQA